MSRPAQNMVAMGEPKSQYHHYIPRFILKPFSHPFRRSKKKDKDGPKKQFRPGQEMLYTINLAGDGEIVEAPLEKSFGLKDMYRDLRDAGNQHHIEQKLSVLESQAGQIISRMRQTHESGEKDVWMTRKERDTLRKFLFIMKYRSMDFHKRFQHDTADEYCADDKERFLKYMAEKGFTRPMDVWLDNIKAILGLKMDPDANWGKELMDQMYPDDAKWAFSHIQAMYLALCSPSNKDEEFILSENLFSIYEGPTSLSYDMQSGESTPIAYTEHHIFAVVSPKLMIVLRSNFLPNPEEDTTEEMKQAREDMYNAMMRTHHDPSTARSVFEDLPVRKANNSYTKFVGAKRVLVEGEDGSPKANHRFGFPFFPIGSDHVNKINCVIFQEASRIQTLAFKSKAAALRTLEWNLSNSSLIDIHEPEDSKFVCLKKLINAAQSLGSKDSTVSELSRLSQERNALLGSMDRELEKRFSDNAEGPSAPYVQLGGTAKTFFYDMDQARKMLNMRIKIDVWSKGVDEDIRHQGRENLRELFCQLPPRRVYLYMKATRSMVLNERHRKEGLRSPKDLAEHIVQGPEDAIAKAASVFQSNRLSTTLYFTALNAIEMAKNPDISIDTKITMDARGIRILDLMKKVAFGPAGSICDCALPPLSHKALTLKSLISTSPRLLASSFRRSWLPEEENIEMATRILVEREFMDVMDGMLPKRGDLVALKEAVFGALYPTVGRGED